MFYVQILFFGLTVFTEKMRNIHGTLSTVLDTMD